MCSGRCRDELRITLSERLFCDFALFDQAQAPVATYRAGPGRRPPIKPRGKLEISEVYHLLCGEVSSPRTR